MSQENTGDNIDVVIYSYKSKDVIDTLEQLILKSSKKYNFNIYWYDQNGLDRSKLLIDLVKDKSLHGNYIPVHWDSINGAVIHKNNIFKNIKSTGYLLMINPGTIFKTNWDAELIEFIKDKKIIISGNNNIKITKNNLFFIKKNMIESKDFTLTNYIDRSFIFGKVSNFKNSFFGSYNFPSWLKYYGEEELLSLQYFKDKIEIFSCPNTVVQSSVYSTIEDFNYYITFSKYHNYNEVISLFKNGINNIDQIDDDIITNFNDFHNFDFSSLSYLPFSTNDVEYESSKSKYDKIDGNRFLKPIRKVD